MAVEGLEAFSLGKSLPPYSVATYIKGKKVREKDDGIR